MSSAPLAVPQALGLMGGLEGMFERRVGQRLAGSFPGIGYSRELVIALPLLKRRLHGSQWHVLDQKGHRGSDR